MGRIRSLWGTCVPSQATQLPLRNLGTHYIALGGSEHAGGASRVSFTDPDRSLFSRAPRRSARHNAWMDGALRPTRLRARRPRAVLADSKGLWWGPRATESTRPARRCVEPSVKKYRTAQRHVAQSLAISRRIIRVPASDSTGSHGFAGSRWKLGWVAHVTHTHKTPPVAQSGRGPYPHTAHTDRQTE